jgi:Uri superfamily endonuclease
MAGLSMSCGSYIIVFKLEGTRNLRIGKLGRFHFAPGYYLYVGRHTKYLEKRVQRHLKGGPAKRWHLDYLRAVCRPLKAYVIPDDLDECGIARQLVLKGGEIPFERFGASDCRCPGHLIYFENKRALSVLNSNWIVYECPWTTRR